MKKLLVLSKQYPDLALCEALSIIKPKSYEIIDNLLIAEPKTKIKLWGKLGFTHSIYKFLFKCSKNEINEHVETFPWDKIYRENFCIRVHDTDEFSEKMLADIIYKKINSPKVSLSDPKTRIDFFFRDDIAICGLFESDTDKSYLTRKAHLRPSLHPTSLHPAIARACINLTGKTKGKLLDPFCGSAGILIEAGLMGFDVIGYDIDEGQIARAKKNLEHYSIKNYKLLAGDSLAADYKAGCIVTDPPYGRGSKGKNIEALYKDFIIKLGTFSGPCVILFPDFIDYKKIIKNSGRPIDKEFRIYVHKSLTRFIVRLSPLSRSLS